MTRDADAAVFVAGHRGMVGSAIVRRLQALGYLAGSGPATGGVLADPKERAEHVMLVDLARNDLGRVCEPGSVSVVDFMGVERYSHVMHLTSHVVGKLAKGKTWLAGEGVSFGQFSEANLDNFVSAIQLLTAQIAAVAGLPPRAAARIRIARRAFRPAMS